MHSPLAIVVAVVAVLGGGCPAPKQVIVSQRPRLVVLVVVDQWPLWAYERDRGVFDEKRGGMGLALPLARRVIEGHGGRIAAPAPAPGPDAGPSHDPLAADPVSRGSAIITLPLTE